MQQCVQTLKCRQTYSGEFNNLSLQTLKYLKTRSGESDVKMPSTAFLTAALSAIAITVVGLFVLCMAALCVLTERLDMAHASIAELERDMATLRATLEAVPPDMENGDLDTKNAHRDILDKLDMTAETAIVSINMPANITTATLSDVLTGDNLGELIKQHINGRLKRAAKRRRQRKQRKCKVIHTVTETNVPGTSFTKLLTTKMFNCLPAVQIEGSGGRSSGHSHTDLAGWWNPASWVHKDTRSRVFFNYQRIGETGQLKVKKAGIYLLYAQLTLVGESKLGYSVIKKYSTNGDIMKIAMCSNNPNGQLGHSNNIDSGASCSTVGVFQFNKNDIIYLEEHPNSSGAHYESSFSYFGLVKIGNTS